jgi:hypothetical protein
MRTIVLSLALLSSLLLAPVPAARAITVTPTQNTTTLVNALLGGGGTGIVVTGVTLSGHTQNSFENPGQIETSSGTYVNPSGTYGIGAGVVLSTGAVQHYGDGANTSDQFQTAYFTPTFEFAYATPAQELLLDPITTVGQDTFDHFDATELLITFDMQQGVDFVRFHVVFGSEEWPEYAEIGYFDGFGMFLNGTNVAFVQGQPVNITHPSMADVSGTELDGVLAPGGNPLLIFGGPVNPTGNTLRFIIADREDPILDSTVYISGLQGTVPEPASAATALAAIGALAGLRRAQRGSKRFKSALA